MRSKLFSGLDPKTLHCLCADQEQHLLRLKELEEGLKMSAGKTSVSNGSSRRQSIGGSSTVLKHAKGTSKLNDRNKVGHIDETCEIGVDDDRWWYGI